MAQSKSFFGLRKGSTKSLTFQVLNGKQITKDRVYNVKNPQSLAQMQQRALMATVVTAYSTLKEICDHSFEGVEVGAKSMAEFIKNNLGKLSGEVPNINVTEYKSGLYADNKYMISKGTLTPPTTTASVTSFNVSTGLSQKETAIKWSEIASSMGIKKGGMLTFVVVGEGKCFWLRIKFNEALWDSEVKKEESNINELAAIGAIEGNTLELNDSFVLTKDESDQTYKFSIALSGAETAAAIISEKVEGIWKRSTAYLDGEINYLYEAGFATYPINTSLLLNGGKMPNNIIKK